MRTASGENREKFRTKESRRKKNCTCNYPSPRHVGKWDSFGQPDLLSLPRWQQVLYAERTNLFLSKKKLARRCALSWCKKRRIKSREMNANTFYVLRKHASYARFACFLRKLVESFFVGSRASCTCLNVPSSRHAARSFSTERRGRLEYSTPRFL